jgi:hypothetical protein
VNDNLAAPITATPPIPTTLQWQHHQIGVMTITILTMTYQCCSSDVALLLLLVCHVNVNGHDWNVFDAINHWFVVH